MVQVEAKKLPEVIKKVTMGVFASSVITLSRRSTSPTVSRNQLFEVPGMVRAHQREEPTSLS